MQLILISIRVHDVQMSCSDFTKATMHQDNSSCNSHHGPILACVLQRRWKHISLDRDNSDIKWKGITTSSLWGYTYFMYRWLQSTIVEPLPLSNLSISETIYFHCKMHWSSVVFYNASIWQTTPSLKLIDMHFCKFCSTDLCIWWIECLLHIIFITQWGTNIMTKNLQTTF